ncbi:MAG: type II toxin-antitoxin system death-on-curing family toxin [Thaumarchaeota archaeon]|nr:type II toxin-antitoxin system death-on-curing family toxin [Nitrososphaerota archaeon]
MEFKYPTFEAIVEFNRQEVTSSSEQYKLEDENRLRKILEDVKKQGEELSIKEALIKKTSFLIFRMTSVQPFHEGNKRTAYVTTKVFLNANGFSIRVSKEEVFEILEGIVFGRINLNHVEQWLKDRLIEL